MGDTVVTILAIVLAAVLMFVFPLMSVADRSDDVSQLSVQNSTTTFVDNIRSTGRITLAEYNRFAQEINSTGNTYSIEMEVKILDENPGKKTAQTTYEKIGENVYYTEYTTQIMEDLNDARNNNTKYLKEGDIVSVDLVAYKDGFNGDCARTYAVGKIDKASQKLIDITKQAFFEGIKYAKKGNRLGDVSHAIGEFVAKNGFSVVREFQGHGIGREMHEDPGIPNYGKAGRGPRLEPGMTLAIEPMVIAGKPNILELDDGWGIITEDGTRAAHYENTILITEKEPKILTLL